MKIINKVFLFGFIFSIFSFSDVFAANVFNLGSPINEVRISVKRPTSTITRYVKYISSNHSDDIAYCLEMGKYLADGIEYNEELFNPESIMNISKETWDRITNIAYFGYRYGNHNDLYWYAITQIMIWRIVHPDWVIEIVDQSTNKVNNDLYNNEINEISNLVLEHEKKVSFNGNNYDVNIGDYLDIIDNNNVLSTYSIIDGELNTNIVNNKLVFFGDVPGDYKITINKSNAIVDKRKILYLDNYQKLAYVPNPSGDEVNITVHVKGGMISINKLDFDTKSNVAQGDASLEKAVYGIYNYDDELVTSITTNGGGEGISNYIRPGKYKVKEITPSYGYELDNSVYEVEVFDGNVSSINVYEKVIERKIFIEKYLDNNGKLTSESNITFKITDSKGNNSFIITNKYGKISTVLPFGVYKFEQINTTYGYNKVNDFTVIINENSDKYIKYVLEDELIYKHVVINKKDKDTDLNIGSGFSFKIFDKSNNKYVVFDDSEVFTTNDLGIIELELPYGTYIIEEVNKVDGFLQNNEKIEFEITESSKNIINFYNKREIIEEYDIPLTMKNDYNHMYLLFVGVIYVFKKVL